MIDFDLTAPMNDWLPTVTYPGFRPGLPDIVLGRLPAAFAAIMDHPYKSWIIENHKEAALLKARLAEPLPITALGQLDFISGPDSAVRKKSRGIGGGGDVMVMIYSPPAEGWPHLVLLCLPVHDDDMERGRYAWEVFDDEQGAVDHATEILRKIGQAPVIMGPESLIRS